MKRVIFDTDPSLLFEGRCFISRMGHFFLISILNNLPSSSRSLIKQSHSTAKKVIDNVTTHDAIEVFYSHEGKNHRSLLQKFFYTIWFNLDNPRAVRNRLKLVEREVKRAASELLDKGDAVNILSIASGSSRAIVESLLALGNGGYPNIAESLTVVFLDKNPKANAYSKKLVDGTWIADHARWITDNATNFPSHYGNEPLPNIVEMVGLLDYFDDEKIMRIFKTIYDSLPEGGVLITANIMNNKEREFVTRVIGWEMIYRHPEELIDLATKVGFKKELTIAYCEPLGIHFVMVAKK